MDEEQLKAAIVEAGEDKKGIACRKEVGEALVAAFRNVGEGLWFSGAIIGGDRVDGVSPFGFGSDATVGLGTVVQMAGELSSGVVDLLGRDNRYGAAALLRQLVEVEYLTWAFAEDEDEAMRWMWSTREERLRMWQPGRIRKRAGDRFRGSDYALHCEHGGHPTPEGMHLLPTHRSGVPDFFAWNDLAFHGLSAWAYILATADRLEFGGEIRELPVAEALTAAEDRRQREDRLIPLLADAWHFLDRS